MIYPLCLAEIRVDMRFLPRSKGSIELCGVESLGRRDES
jgi:hypothetical protein